MRRTDLKGARFSGRKPGLPINTYLRFRASFVPRGGKVSAQQFEFTEERRRRFTPARVPRTRMFRGDLVAEIIADRRERPEVVHCVVQRQGSPEVLFLQQFYSREEAKVAAEQFMSTYARQSKQAKVSG